GDTSGLSRDTSELFMDTSELTGNTNELFRDTSELSGDTNEPSGSGGEGLEGTRAMAEDNAREACTRDATSKYSDEGTRTLKLTTARTSEPTRTCNEPCPRNREGGSPASY